MARRGERKAGRAAGRARSCLRAGVRAFARVRIAARRRPRRAQPAAACGAAGCLVLVVAALASPIREASSARHGAERAAPGTQPASGDISADTLPGAPAARVVVSVAALNGDAAADRSLDLHAHDALIRRVLAEYRADRRVLAGLHGTPDVDNLPSLDGEQGCLLVKAWALTESAGRLPAERPRIDGERSAAAWTHDPFQVNNHGDWAPLKAGTGLAPPARRVLLVRAGTPGKTHYNADMTPEKSLRAALMWLLYKGHRYDEHGVGTWRGLEAAFLRYNGGGDPEYLDKLRWNLRVLAGDDAAATAATAARDPRLALRGPAAGDDASRRAPASAGGNASRKSQASGRRHHEKSSA